MTRALSFTFASILLAAAGCTYDEYREPTTPPPQGQTVVVQQQPQAYPQAQPQAQYVGGQPSATSGYTTSNFGTVALRPGFVPDPHVVQGRSGGGQNASGIDAACRGWITSTPDHLFVAQDHFQSLRLVASSSDDITLVVLRPDGQYMCNDDAEGRNPMIGGSFPAGTYAVWVGSYQQGVVAPYRIGFSELNSVTPSTLGSAGGGQAQATPVATTGSGMQSNFGTVSLRAGFTPDPFVSQGTSGGSVEARQMSTMCRGWVSARPDHVFVAQSSFDNLKIMVRSDADTTLVIQDANGRWFCDDDTEGRNPVVGGRFAPGAYRVWVGSYRQGEMARYSIGFTELSNVGTMSLPSP